ncbi:MAG: nucleotidyltransferase domain-containing protein [Cyanobacteria bacterium J06621_11]
MSAILSQLHPKTAERLNLSEGEINAFCQKWGIKNMALFGSVLRSDFSPDSDVDFLISFLPDARQGLLTIVRIKYELESFIHRSVDITIKQSVEASHNWIRQHEILSTAHTIYELD